MGLAHILIISSLIFQSSSWAKDFPDWNGCQARLTGVSKEQIIEKLSNGYAEFQNSFAERWQGWGVKMEKMRSLEGTIEYCNHQPYVVDRVLGFGFHSMVYQTKSFNRPFTIKHFRCPPTDRAETLAILQHLRTAGLPAISILDEEVLSDYEMIHVYPYVHGLPMDYVFNNASKLQLTPGETKFFIEEFGRLQQSAAEAVRYFQSYRYRLAANNVMFSLETGTFLIIDGN